MSTRACCGNFKLRFEYWPVIWLWPISLVLMQATLLEIGDFAVTVAVIACSLHRRSDPFGPVSRSAAIPCVPLGFVFKRVRTCLRQYGRMRCQNRCQKGSGSPTWPSSG
jgi:hypothetical protein